MARLPNTHLTALFEATGWSPGQLARALREVASEEGLDLACNDTTVRRWLAGTQPRRPYPTLLLECLTRRLGRRITPQEAGLTRTPAVVVDPSWETDPVGKLAHLAHTELNSQRQVLLDTSVVTLTSIALRDLTTLPSPPRRPKNPLPDRPHADQREVDQLRAMAAVFVATADKYGGQHVRAALTAYLLHDVLPVLNTSARVRTHHELLIAASHLTLLMGTMCADSGHGSTAQHYRQIAARLAADAGDHATLAIALRAMATHAHDLGNHTPAVLHLAEYADQHARHASPSVRAYTHIHLAVMNAHHNRRAALTALARAENLHTHSAAPPGPFSSYPASALHYQRAQTLATLGDHTNALTALTTSLHLRSPTDKLRAALTHARLAETHLRLGHLEQALAHWNSFLDIYPALHSTRAKQCLRTALQRLRPFQRHPAVSDVLARGRYHVNSAHALR
ncbi:hypothetical protein [Streptomyces sp. NPDC007205]|uniref:tetratricopeptide repeat protein n=1 Tax=Streptomyces sp. NPDC007205 TaxID=3154316 RepID=UPI0034020BCE